MIIIVAIITGGRFIFAAPGATHIIQRRSYYGHGLTKREIGTISIVGPLTNLALAFIFAIPIFVVPFGGILTILCSFGYQINLWLAAFNLIPIGELDGRKIISWNNIIWAVVTIPVWIVVGLLLFI